jgi:LuxR family maltose regulon positive regulatory protein
LPRPRLVEKLQESTAYRLALISASAGSGKTTLLSEWTASSQRSIAWISLDAGDNDPVVFLTYFIAALGTLQADFGRDTLESLRNGQVEASEVLLIELINELAEFEIDFSLVLDDYHAIQAPRTHELMAFLVEHLPPQMHLVLASRSDPPFPLARYRARKQLYEIRSADLRFSAEETAGFLKRVPGLEISAGEVAALEQRTEGWAAGLQLAALSLQGRSDGPAFVQDFTGSHRYVAEYLVEEVLQRQPAEVRSFLLQTSILTRLSAGLCEAVCGCPDGQALLEHLHRENLFVIPLDSDGHWFRYHHLFADLLQARLRHSHAAEEVAALQLRAVDWYERQGLLPEAIEHALDARDFGRAAALLDQAAQRMGFSEQYRRLSNWLEVLPEAAFQAHPRLEVYRLMIELSKGTLDMYEETLREKEKLIKALPPSPANDRLRREAMVYLSAFYAHQNTAHAIEIAQATLQGVQPEETRLQAMLYSTLYRAYGMEGDIKRSAPAYRESLRLALAAGEYGMLANTTMVRAFDLCQYGRLEEAARYCREILEAGAATGQRVFYPGGPVLIGLGGLHLERLELQQAQDCLARGLELCHQGAAYGLYTAYIQWARLQQAQGDLEGAWQTLQQLEQRLQRWDFTLAARQVSLRLAQGDTAGAAGLAEPLRAILGASHYARRLPLIAAEAFKLCLARLALAQGDHEHAYRLLEEIQTTVEPGQRDGRLLEVHLLRALAHQLRDGGHISAAAVNSLKEALALAEPAGFGLLFLEEGPALVPLLQAVVERSNASQPVQATARRLLQAFRGVLSDAPIQPASAVSGLVELLTERELEVLQLLALGDSNQTIAEKLVITVRTVKKHNSNIYGKLGVDNRIQAVAQARELGLLATD